MRTRRLPHRPVFVPPGTPDNSPPLQRWDHESLAVRSPDRGDRNPHTVAALSRSHDRGVRRLLPSLTGLDGLVGIAFPPLKRWAIRPVVLILLSITILPV